jgi:hypothetical protein
MMHVGFIMTPVGLTVNLFNLTAPGFRLSSVLLMEELCIGRNAQVSQLTNPA